MFGIKSVVPSFATPAKLGQPHLEDAKTAKNQSWASPPQYIQVR